MMIFLEKAFLPGLKMTWATAALVHVVVRMGASFLKHRLAASVSDVDCPWVDFGIAGEHLHRALAATELRTGTGSAGSSPESSSKLVGWPQSIKPAVVPTVGDPGMERRAVNSRREGVGPYSGHGF